MSLDNMPINSLGWWDGYFVKQWETNQGCEQTQAFMCAILQHLPRQEKHWIGTQAAILVDWGCALGDGLSTLGRYFTGKTLVGIDFSNTARNKAQQRFEHYFFYKDWSAYKAIFPKCDVVFNSNCLEHFQEPYCHLVEGLAYTKSLYCILVPFEEQEPLCESHCQVFNEKSFPKKINGFRLIYQKVVDVDNRYWTGQQLLIIYASKSYRNNTKSSIWKKIRPLLATSLAKLRQIKRRLFERIKKQ